MADIQFDKIERVRTQLGSPITQIKSVDVSAANKTIAPAAYMYSASGGNISCIPADNGTTAVTLNLTAGQWHPVRVKQINTSGTAATGILVGI